MWLNRVKTAKENITRFIIRKKNKNYLKRTLAIKKTLYLLK
jgi:prephenate dehydratase